MTAKTITSPVSEFYHKIQFPGHYTQEEILEKTNDFFLQDYLELDLLPFRGKVFEAGCGTGYTTHVISNLRRDVTIKAVDFSSSSIEFAKKITDKHDYENIDFELMDLRSINMGECDFDMLVCSGVLHHIENPRPIFSELCKLVKTNGIIIVGLYHPWGRFSTHLRQKIFKITRGRGRWIDPRIRKEKWSDERKNIWFRDQYEHPLEKDYSHKTLLKWFDDEGVSLIGSIPKYTGNDFEFNLNMLLSMGSQGGLYIFIGQKN